MPKRRRRVAGWPARLVASRGFQRWAARFPLTRGLVRREGEALFDLLAGFCHSQVLMALVQLEIPEKLMQGAQSAAALARVSDVPEDRMVILLRAGVSLGLLKIRRGGAFALTTRGAALVGVPGLAQMIRHHDVFYRDLADPVAFFRGDVETELAGFWPYVFGGDMAPEVAQTYSDLMAESQVLVAEDTLDSVNLSGARHLMDVGGGTGVFAGSVGKAYPGVELTLFDLPQVADAAHARFAQLGLSERAQVVSGSFRDGALPKGADAISLVRVLYDHADDTVADLLATCFAALPPGGMLLISEPMTGGARPERAGDVYFALYTLAMRTGRARSIEEISDLVSAAGFNVTQTPKPRRVYVTRCLVAQKPTV
ncbi:methyltransferase domain-containing protein [Sulfitobacter sp. TSTF-M16]|uniref:Methyltransferase domain-containing protein n=2 Tax=Sulfitobacter aestuariivivens TaxID=2766981 RepID=A0A927D7M4_9RHOB|nr:methyltransferase [Sulfitobacter aestuariivivens]MBD3665057.1 methyltransferase domain-containing protein [Sulfitobacter aestuariivivens]